jgi:hypothetical protein
MNEHTVNSGCSMIFFFTEPNVFINEVSNPTVLRTVYCKICTVTNITLLKKKKKYHLIFCPKCELGNFHHIEEVLHTPLELLRAGIL